MLSVSPTSDTCFDWNQWLRPAAAYSQAPFWFWNDRLDEAEIARQLDDFQAHGIDAFVIHPRIGLPVGMEFLDAEFFRYMRFALEEARRRGMWVILYDEGMYPSGSASGQVVEHHPEFRVRGLVCKPFEAGEQETSERRRVATVPRGNGELVTVWEQPIESVIRGLHYIGDENAPCPGEEEPPAADILNPRAVERFIHLVYDRFYAELGEYFGDTVKAIFTDEAEPLGRSRTPDARPGYAALLPMINRHLGYDFTPHLPALWHDDVPDFKRYRRDYAEAIAARLDATYYGPISRWCEAHGVCLTGHPAGPCDIGHLRFFQWPGQDVVLRQVVPDSPSSVEGPFSTLAKGAASAAFHGGRGRNLNEYIGGYGVELPFEELHWMAYWLLIRGCDLLVPHAFYYSMRGPRKNERPPDVGPNSPWWPAFGAFADITRRLCWLNAEFRPVCHVAIAGHATDLPWKAARVCYENQIDFHYVGPHDLERASVENGTLRIGPGRYSAVLVEDGYPFPESPAGIPVVRFSEGDPGAFRARCPAVVTLDSPAPSLRARHLCRGDAHVILLFNEGEDEVSRRVTLPVTGEVERLNLVDDSRSPAENQMEICLPPHEWAVFLVTCASREKAL
jgi:hypothetical protein